MGSVYLKTFTKPLPAGAEIFVRKGERFARWKDRKGKARTAPLTVGKDGSERVTPAMLRDGRALALLGRALAGCRN